jgi:hypothetical protein
MEHTTNKVLLTSIIELSMAENEKDDKMETPQKVNPTRA